MPQRGMFVENRLRHLLKHSDAQSRVISPIPAVPPGVMRTGDYLQFASVPKRVERNGTAIRYPRYMHIPKIGKPFQPFAMARANWATWWSPHPPLGAWSPRVPHRPSQTR